MTAPRTDFAYFPRYCGNDLIVAQKLGGLAISLGFMTDAAENLAAQDGAEGLAAQMVDRRGASKLIDDVT